MQVDRISRAAAGKAIEQVSTQIDGEGRRVPLIIALALVPRQRTEPRCAITLDLQWHMMALQYVRDSDL
jgi:hypothetical protein